MYLVSSIISDNQIKFLLRDGLRLCAVHLFLLNFWKYSKVEFKTCPFIFEISLMNMDEMTKSMKFFK